MAKKDFKVVNFEGFVSQFMSDTPAPFESKKSPIQIYPLNIAFSFIKPPVELFRTDYNFLLLFTNGGGEQQVDNEIIKLQANDVLFIREGHLNAIKYIDPKTEGYYIHIESLLLPQIFTNNNLLNRFTFNPKHTVSKIEMEWLCQCCKLLLDHQTNFIFSVDIETALLKSIVSRLGETWSGKGSKPDRSSEITMLFKELLYDNFKQKRDIKFYAEGLTVSENYLNRCVTSITEKSPKQHINEMVIHHSKILLQNFSKDISEIAFELNFSDPSYFGKLFKQLTNLTPSQYRSSFTQGLS